MDIGLIPLIKDVVLIRGERKENRKKEV